MSVILSPHQRMRVLNGLAGPPKTSGFGRTNYESSRLETIRSLAGRSDFGLLTRAVESGVELGWLERQGVEVASALLARTRHPRGDAQLSPPLWIALADDGVALRSLDGVAWQPFTPRHEPDWNYQTLTQADGRLGAAPHGPGPMCGLGTAPTKAGLLAVTTDGYGRTVGVGSGGCIAVADPLPLDWENSNDNWSEEHRLAWRDLGTCGPNTLWAVATNSNRSWIAGGVYGQLIASSDDGLTWRDLGAHSDELSDILWALGFAPDGTYVAAGPEVFLLRGVDGEDPERIDHGFHDVHLKDVVGAGNGLWLAVGTALGTDEAGGVVARSTDDGRSWELLDTVLYDAVLQDAGSLPRIRRLLVTH